MKSATSLYTSEVTRLFSNLSLEGNRFNHQPETLLGCTALVAATTVGAGILALPAVTLPSGLVPSTVMLLAVWLYALASGLLIAAVNVNAMRTLGQPGVGLLAMIEGILGKLGALDKGNMRASQSKAKIVFSCGVDIGARLSFLGRRDTYPTEMYLHSWEAPGNIK